MNVVLDFDPHSGGSNGVLAACASAHRYHRVGATMMPRCQTKVRGGGCRGLAEAALDALARRQGWQQTKPQTCIAGDAVGVLAWS
jgi:hypothetical protein